LGGACGQEAEVAVGTVDHSIVLALPVLSYWTRVNSSFEEREKEHTFYLFRFSAML
jgi:hypothetical protein